MFVRHKTHLLVHFYDSTQLLLMFVPSLLHQIVVTRITYLQQGSHHRCSVFPIVRRCSTVDGHVTWHRVCLFVWLWVTLRAKVSLSASLGVEPHLGLMIRCYVLFESYDFVNVGRPLWREVGSVICHRLCQSIVNKFNIYSLLCTRITYIHNIYKASVSPGWEQQIMPYLM
jgi:hypothetical protein